MLSLVLLSDLLPRATVDLDVALDGKAQAQAEAMHQHLTDARLVPYVVRDEAGDPIEQQYQFADHGTRDRDETSREFLVPFQGPKRHRAEPKPRPARSDTQRTNLRRRPADCLASAVCVGGMSLAAARTSIC